MPLIPIFRNIANRNIRKKRKKSLLFTHNIVSLQKICYKHIQTFK